MTHLRRLAALRPCDFALLSQAGIVLIRTRVLLWALPWHRLVAERCSAAPDAPPAVTIAKVEWAVRHASRIVPCATCLTQALALKHLLSRYGYSSSVQIGINRDDGRFGAHAWVECEGRTLLSRPFELAQYVHLFTWPAGRPDRFR